MSLEIIMKMQNHFKGPKFQNCFSFQLNKNGGGRKDAQKNGAPKRNSTKKTCFTRPTAK